MIRRLGLILCAILSGSLALPAFAHKASDSYLVLRADGADTAASLDGQWDIALRDLDFAIGIDANGDGEITWGEVKARHAAIAAYALSRLQLRGDGEPCLAKPTAHLIDEHSDGAYAVLRFTASCVRPVVQLEIDYRLLFDLDPQHRGLLRLEKGGATRTAIFSPAQPTLKLDVATAGASSRWGELLQYGREGIWHIWIGFDHVLFLISLLLPAVLTLRARAWQPVDAFRPALWDVVRIVTAFTVAHSITLTLATIGVVSLPSRLVESVIAISVVLAAANNLYPVVGGSRWVVAFGFGLIHGFGFATVLAELGLRSSTLLVALIGFNVGVEIGQLAIVLGFLPTAYVVRATWVYRRLVVVGGSVVIILIAALWFCERAFNLDLLSV